VQEITLQEGFYQSDDFNEVVKNLAKLEKELEVLYEKWEELDR
jgi:tetrahydromethanopterin S-methyltransferase subunit G